MLTLTTVTASLCATWLVMHTKWIAQQGLHLIQAFLYVIGLKTSNARLEVGSYYDVEASLQPLR